MRVGILPLTGSNFASVRYALPVSADVSLVHHPEQLLSLTHLILPGVGHASRLNPQAQKEWLPALREFSGPVLGICLGMQIMFEQLEEDNVGGLGLFKGRVRRIPHSGNPVPHIGWQKLQHKSPHPLFAGLEEASFYFVHSFAAPPTSETLATVSYNGLWTAAVQRGNFYGLQFHPEKSGEAGKILLQNFLETPLCS